MTPTENHADDDRTWYRTFCGLPGQIREARRFVRAHIPGSPDVELVASELGTNAMRHTDSGRSGGTFRVRIEHRPDGSTRLEVEDDGGPADFETPTADHTREGGRGLSLVQACATAWGVKGDAGGRTVWAEFPP
ncbi:MAG: putative signal transduction histidine kinase [Streptosporangiaceae bacterium]|jgi:serine/threonine-protein kinase RsbW|nr:putative signal transduction histidine kinase [Streptosporangiaceae bacterium]